MDKNFLRSDSLYHSEKNALKKYLVLLISSITFSISYADTFTYNDAPAGGSAIDTNIGCAAPNGGAGAAQAFLDRPINVTNSFIVNDLDVGFIATHSWRGDIELTLISPAGTSQILLIPDTTNTGNEDNWDLALDDDTAAGVADDNNNDNVAAPNYAADRSGTPNNPLSVFDGENAFGVWTVRICDKYPTQDNGNYISSQLLFDGNPIADVELTKMDTSVTYTPGLPITYFITITNNGPENASGLTVTDNLPAGLTLIGPVTCVATGAASCGSATFGAAGGTGFSDTAASVNAGAGNSLLYTINALPSVDMADY